MKPVIKKLHASIVYIIIFI